MNQTEELLSALKKQLRARNMSYKDVASALEMSEASIKRLFSEKTFSLKRLEAVCDLLQITIFDLAKQTRLSETAHSTTLSLDQEKALANDPLLLVYFYLLINFWSPARIEKDYGLSKSQNIKLLTTLDKLDLIELCHEIEFDA